MHLYIDMVFFCESKVIKKRLIIKSIFRTTKPFVKYYNYGCHLEGYACKIMPVILHF